MVVINSFKSSSEIAENVLALPTSLSLDNFKEAWSRLNYLTAFKQTFLVSLFSTIGEVIIAGMTGYWIIRHPNKFTKTWHTLIMAFDPDSSEFDATIESYSYPKVYEGVDFTKANEIIGTYNSSAAKAFPLFAANEKVTAVHIDDFATLKACKLFIDVTIAIAVEADANAYVTTLTSLATTAGFVLATTYTWAKDGYEELSLGDNLSILVAAKVDDKGAYAGGIIVELSDSTAA